LSKAFLLQPGEGFFIEEFRHETEGKGRGKAGTIKFVYVSAY